MKLIAVILFLFSTRVLMADVIKISVYEGDKQTTYQFDNVAKKQTIFELRKAPKTKALKDKDWNNLKKRLGKLSPEENQKLNCGRRYVVIYEDYEYQKERVVCMKPRTRLAKDTLRIVRLIKGF